VAFRPLDLLISKVIRELYATRLIGISIVSWTSSFFCSRIISRHGTDGQTDWMQLVMRPPIEGGPRNNKRSLHILVNNNPSYSRSSQSVHPNARQTRGVRRRGCPLPDGQISERARNLYRCPAGRTAAEWLCGRRFDGQSPGQHAIACTSHRGWSTSVLLAACYRLTGGWL